MSIIWPNSVIVAFKTLLSLSYSSLSMCYVLGKSKENTFFVYCYPDVLVLQTAENFLFLLYSVIKDRTFVWSS